MQIRRMVEADVEAAAAIQSAAFGSPPAERIRRLHEGPRATWRDGWVASIDTQIGAVAAAYPATWWLGGASYTASTIGSVAVRATDRRRGLASALMRAILQADLEAQRPFSMLYPFQHGFYRRLGYATAGFTSFYRLPLGQMPDDAALRQHVRFVRDTDRPTIADLHQRSLATLGGLQRNAAQWQQRWQTTTQTWVVYDNGTVGGYLAYERADAELQIGELVAPTAEAERGLWSFVAAQIEQCQAAIYHAPAGTPLWAMLREPLMYQPANRGFILNDAATLTASLMVRLVDLPAALGRRRFAPNLSGSIALALSDPVLDANNATFAITFKDGQTRAERTNVAPAAHCDVVTLAQLFCGVLRAVDARWYGLLQADDAIVTLLDQAFGGGAMPFLHPADWF